MVWDSEGEEGNSQGDRDTNAEELRVCWVTRGSGHRAGAGLSECSPLCLTYIFCKCLCLHSFRQLGEGQSFFLSLLGLKNNQINSRAKETHFGVANRTSGTSNLSGPRDRFRGRQFSHGPGGGRGFRIQALCSYFALYFYCYDINSTSDHQAFDPRGWGPLSYSRISNISLL